MSRPTLRKGMSGVKGTPVGDAILLWRNYMGLPPAPGVTSFDFGSSTAQKTIEWQRAHGLDADGVVGGKSWAKYDELNAAPHESPAETPPADMNPYLAYAGIPAVQEAAKQAVQAIKAQAPAPLPAAVQAAKAVSSAALIPAAAHTAAAVIKKTAAKPAAKKPAHTPTPTKKAGSELQHLVKSTPLWAQIALGAVGSLFAIFGLKQVFKKA